MIYLCYLNFFMAEFYWRANCLYRSSWQFDLSLHCGSVAIAIMNWVIGTQCMSYKWTNDMGSVCTVYVVFYVRPFNIVCMLTRPDHLSSHTVYNGVHIANILGHLQHWAYTTENEGKQTKKNNPTHTNTTQI
jgi:hypothetical protein